MRPLMLQQIISLAKIALQSVFDGRGWDVHYCSIVPEKHGFTSFIMRLWLNLEIKNIGLNRLFKNLPLKL